MSSDGLNRVTLLGNLGADAEVRSTSGGQCVAKIRLATTETYFDKNRVKQERTDWHMVVLFGKRAEALGRILTKGDRILVEGRIQTSSYDDRDGNKRYKTEIVANNIILCGGRRGQQAEQTQQAPSGDNGFSDADYGGGSDDDFPFG